MTNLRVPEDEEALDQCRLCLMDGGEDLIRPCDCSGTSRWVHRSCLNQWRYHAQPVNPKAMSHCPTCRFQYKLYCTFDVHVQRRRRRRHVMRVVQFSVGLFVAMQALIVLLGIIVGWLDRGGFVLKLFNIVDPPSLLESNWKHFFKHQVLYYYCAAAVLFFGLIGIAYCVASCLCSPSETEDDARTVRPRYGRRESCADDCLRSCFFFPDPGPCVCSGDCCAAGSCSGCALEGEGALLILGVVVIVAILLSIFVAVFLLSVAVQRAGQRYLKAIYLKDVADRFAVVDLEDEAPPSDLSQEQIQQMMQYEIKVTRGLSERLRGQQEGPQERQAGDAGEADVVAQEMGGDAGEPPV